MIRQEHDLKKDDVTRKKQLKVVQLEIDRITNLIAHVESNIENVRNDNKYALSNRADIANKRIEDLEQEVPVMSKEDQENLEKELGIGSPAPIEENQLTIDNSKDFQIPQFDDKDQPMFNGYTSRKTASTF